MKGRRDFGAEGEGAVLQDPPVLLHSKAVKRVVEGVGEMQKPLELAGFSMLEDLMKVQAGKSEQTLQLL